MAQRRALGFLGGHQDQRGGAVGDRAGIGGGDGTVLAERRPEARDLLQVGGQRLLVVLHHALALAAGDGDRDDFRRQRAIGDGGLGALERFDGIGVHLLAGHAVLVGGLLGERTHQTAGTGVLQAVEEHVVLDLAVAHAQAAAGFLQDIGRVGHAFHATGDHHLVGASLEQVVGQHHRLHPRAAQLVDGGAAGGGGQAGRQRGLAGRALLQAGGQDATHDHFLYVLGGDAGALHRFADHDGTQVDRGNAGQAALEAAHGSTGAGDDDDIGHGTLPLVLDRV